MPAQTRYGIFEMGMNHEGELRALTALVRPHIAIVTTIAPAHIEYSARKRRLRRPRPRSSRGWSRGGTAIIPFDSPHCALLMEAAASYAGKIVTFGFGDGADVRALEAVPAEHGGTLVNVLLRDAHLSFTLSMPGRHWIANALAVLAAVQAANADLAVAGLALARLPGMPGRGERRRIRTADGGEALLIDEAYNANPASMAATLAQLGEEGGRRHIAVLGAMKELGAQSASLHAGLAGAVGQARVDHAVLVGEEMAPLAVALSGSIALDLVEDTHDAIAQVAGMLKDGDVVLVKGSNSVGLSRLVTALAAEDGLMLYWLAEQLGFPGILNLFRYLTFRAGAAILTALFIGLVIGPKFIGWLRVRQGQGPADPQRRAADLISPSAARRPWAVS